MSRKKAADLPAISFGAEVCGDPVGALGLEWIETNGIGGFASSTVIGANTRRYHGLLVAALSPPAGRFLTLAKLDEEIVTSSGPTGIGVNYYPGAVFPEGFRYIESFSLDPFPRWIYRVEDIFLEKTVALEYGRNAVWVEYRVREGDGGPAAGGEEFRLSARPLFAFRDYHGLTKRNDECDMKVHGSDRKSVV